MLMSLLLLVLLVSVLVLRMGVWMGVWLCHCSMWRCYVHVVDIWHNVMLGEQVLQKFAGVQLLRLA